VGTGSGPKSKERRTPEHCPKSLVVYLGPIPVPNSWVMVGTGSGPKSNVRDRHLDLDLRLDLSLDMDRNHRFSLYDSGARPQTLFFYDHQRSSLCEKTSVYL